MKSQFLLPVLFIAALISCNTSTTFDLFTAEHGVEFDMLISEGSVFRDGSFTSLDLIIDEGKIVFTGKVDTSTITVTDHIRADGMIVTPGFIDLHSHGNPLQTPGFQNFLSQGVTTICLGQDGSSPAYQNITDWMNQVDSVQPGPNIVIFTGHGTVRRMSGINYEPNPTPEQIDSMVRILSSQLKAGSFGLSTGLEYVPGTYASEEELMSLAKTVGEFDGLIMSHIRNEDNDAVENSIRELLAQGRHCKVHVAHMKVVYGKGRERALEVLSLLDSASSAGISVTADIYPYTASYTGIGILFPAWAKPPANYEQIKRSRRDELEEYLGAIVQKRNGPEATLLGTEPYSGKTLADLSTEMNKSFVDILIDDIGPSGASGAYFIMDESLQESFMTYPGVMVSSDGSPTMRHPRGYGSFGKIIQEYCLEKKILTLEDAITKMTEQPAELLGLEMRGKIDSGYWADVVIFKPEAIRVSATFQDPFKLTEGFNTVLVNGQIAWQDGAPGPARFGKVLRKSSQ